MAQITGRGLSAGVVKAMGIFSGVQMLEIICSIVRMKFVALWIGAAGVGLFGLYNSAIELISGITNLGVAGSSVRDIAASRDNPRLIARTVAIVRRWSLALGLAGAFLTLVLSPLLSRLTFGDSSHTLGFILLSVSIFLMSVTGGEKAILQGLGRLRVLARASVWGTAAGLAVSIPLFYFLRIDSIVPSLLAYVVAAAVAYRVHRVRIPESDRSPISARTTFDEGIGFVRLGIYMTVSTFSVLAVSYIFMAYLNSAGGTETVGYYQAGYTIVNRYVGLIFMAMAMEYYPRLVTVVPSRKRLSTFVSHEMLLAMAVILTPVTFLIALDDVVISLLFDSSFAAVDGFVEWALPGSAFRVASYCMSYVIIAKGDGRTFITVEIISAAVCLTLNIVFFHLWGLSGLGLSYSVYYIIYAAIESVVYRRRYALLVNRRVILFSVCAAAVITGCSVVRSTGDRVVCLVVASVSAVVSLMVVRRMLLRRRD